MTADIDIDAAVARIDHHLAAIPPGRNLITVDEHVNILLDVRNALQETPT